MTLQDLPTLNACLNSLCTTFLLAGWWFISREKKRAHITCMVAALITSAIFLTSYLIYHYQVGHTRFTATGWIRPVYYTILFSHLILAIAIVPLVLCTIIPALRSHFDSHRRVARWTLPLWLYVSVTGVLVYLILYVWFPPAT